MDVPILSMLILVPLIGTIITLFMGGSKQKYAKAVAMVFSVITVVLSLALLVSEDMGAFSESYEWIKTESVIINFALAVDGLSILMVVLTAILVLLVVIFVSDDHEVEEGRPNYFHSLL
ncbi:MAG: dehydrogenase, partial [Candidatus Methanomethylophilaceae archaeon]|nr:dehydrogenase [Candidatus Methanomethylophilaceae archaeon]